MVHDHIDAIMQAWRRERPDLNWSHQEVYFRIARITYLAEQALDRCSRANKLDRGQYSVLAALRRAGAPYRLTPTDLSRTTFCTSGAMTKRLDRLERAGLVVRTPDQNDRRGVLVELTARGLEVVDTTTTAAAAVTFEVMGKLSCAERETISAILRQLEHRLAGNEDGPPNHTDSEPE
jgi:DNA-binding MarR family transcriptional regulator